ncbi:MAG: hypothetical protein H6970_12265 [Gammaproteobacteria bacterium]|nr:hypothetical protein [Gammaproteobacteria bacterium]MCP5425822.1 hypothetical protein [Gammaproteobacteria bacterium]MCP5458567.1 hypothetical protein [Gammaproteobacteria bacterium]
MKKEVIVHLLLWVALFCLLPACSDNGGDKKMDLSGESIGDDTEQGTDQNKQ